jgi:hypothetical protein
MKKQGYGDRMDESSGMRKSKDRGGVFNLKDNTHASTVKYISTNSEKYDMGRIQYESIGSKGYPAEAWNYDY